MRYWTGFIGLAAVLVLGGQAGAQQDAGWWHSAAKLTKGSPENPDAARRGLPDIKDKSSDYLLRSVRAVLARASMLGDRKGGRLLEDLADYFKAVPSRPTTKSEHQKALDAALEIRSQAGLWMALGHIDELIEAGEDPNGLADKARKLDLEAGADNTVATEAGAVLRRVKSISSASEIKRVIGRTRSEALEYYTAIALLKGMDKDRDLVREAKKAVSKLKKWSEEHIEVILDALDAFKTCRTCRGDGKVTCFACKGRGEREIVCPQCDGKGIIPMEELKGSDSIRGRAKGQGAAVQTPDGEIVSVGPDETICPTCIYSHRKKTKKCQFCGSDGVVECQRCKYQKISIDAIGAMEPCENCNGQGTLFRHVWHPCGFCQGVGEFLVPNKDSDKTVAPRN